MDASLHGIIAEFKEADDLLEAAKRTRAEGYRRMDGYSPFPVHGLAEAIDFEDIKVPWMIFICGVAGCVLGFLLQWWINVIDYPLNIGGKPLNSWPAFIPATYECTILVASFGAFFGSLALNGLPRPYHPIFNAPRIELASQDRFFLCIEADDPKFDREKTRDFLQGLGPVAVSEVPN